MNDDSTLKILEDTAEMLAIKLDYEDLRKGAVNTDGGIFMLKGEQRILIHKGLNVKEKTNLLARILSGIDTEGVHIPPAVRKRLEDIKKTGNQADLKPLPDGLLAGLKDG